MKFLMSTAAIAALAFVPATANAQYHGGNSNPWIGAGVGAVAGGVLGSQFAGSGARTEGSAIGAVLGGAAGYAIANRSHASRYGHSGYGYNGGYGYGGASRYGGYGSGGHGGFNGGGFNGGGFVPAGGFVGGGFAPGFVPGPVMNGPTFVNSGRYISGPVIPVTRYIQPAPRPVTILSQPRTVFTAPVYSGITYAAPNVRLAGPPIRSTVVRHTVRTQHMPIARAERYVDPVMADCPAGTTQQSDGTCLERTYTAAPTYTPAPAYTPAPRYTPPVISQPYNPPQMANCPAGTTKQSDGTCLERSYSSSSSSYGVTLPDTHRSSASYSVTLPDTYSSAASYSYSAPQVSNCPSGTSKQSDGTCLSHATTSYTPSYSRSSGSSSSAATTYRAPAPATSYHVPDTIVRAQDEYCYAGSSKRYDSLGNEIKSRHSEHCRQH